MVSAVKKDVHDETDNRMQQFKKKAKELRILDAKTAQNLCKYARFYIFMVFYSQLPRLTLFNEVVYYFQP